jgi:hypothetical protein
MTEYDKSDVWVWENVGSFVATFSDCDNNHHDIEGAADVAVQLGQVGGLWFVRTKDDAGGSDEGPDTAFASADDAMLAAERLVEDNHRAGPNEDAEAYLARVNA